MSDSIQANLLTRIELVDVDARWSVSEDEGTALDYWVVERLELEGPKYQTSTALWHQASTTLALLRRTTFRAHGEVLFAFLHGDGARVYRWHPDPAGWRPVDGRPDLDSLLRGG